jgi:hypothetical protein
MVKSRQQTRIKNENAREKENESEAGDKKRLLDVESEDDLKSDSTFLTIQE